MRLSGLFFRRQKNRGFTLVELAIVLAVASLLFAGLWRLMASGNTQLRDQAAADQHKQLIEAVKSFLSSTPAGSNFRTSTVSPGNTGQLTIPGPACAGDLVGFCPFLPPGFDSNTRNSYGQGYLIYVRVESGSVDNYSFVIVTTGGTAIPNISGGRIASVIGGDGGFIYDTNICGAPVNQWACGAYNGWQVPITNAFAAVPPGYGVPGPNAVSGHIASRTIGGSGQTADPWLARLPGFGGNPVGAPPSPDYYTMQNNMFFRGGGGVSLNMQGNAINLGANGDIVGDLTTSEMRNMYRIQTGDTLTPPAAGYSGSFFLNGPKYASSQPVNPLLSPWAADCTTVGGLPNTCKYIGLLNGNIQVNGMLSANALYAASFVYDTTSDIRLKKNIKALEHSLEKLNKIRAVSFLRPENEKTGFGVIAQEVEKVYPELVTQIGGDYKGVDYMGFIGPLIGAIQELKSQNDLLREQVKGQELSIKDLQAKAKRQK